MESLTFPHRKNADGTVDSICPECYATIACVTNESELEIYERLHECDPVIRERFASAKSLTNHEVLRCADVTPEEATSRRSPQNST